MFEPHYWNARFLQAHGRFVWALARRHFNNYPATAGYANASDWTRRTPRIEIASYGAWGEWHSAIPWYSVHVKRTALQTMILHYHQAFSTGAKRSGKDAPELEQSTVGSTVGAGNDISSSSVPGQ